MMTRLTRAVALCLLLLPVAACGGDGLGPDDGSIVGTWELVTIDGEPLPYFDDDDVVWHSGELEFLERPDRCYFTIQFGNEFGDPTDDPHRLTCTYEYEAPVLFLWWAFDSASEAIRGTLEDGTLRFEDDGPVLVFRWTGL